MFCSLCSCFTWFFFGFVVFGFYSCYFLFQEHLEAFWTSMSKNLIMVQGCLERAARRVHTEASRGAGRKEKHKKKLDPQLDRVVGRVMITENNSTHNSTELWAESWLLKTTRPTTRPSCGPSYMLLKGTRPTTRPSCRPSQGLLLELGPQLDRVVARVSAQKTPFRVLLHFTYLGWVLHLTLQLEDAPLSWGRIKNVHGSPLRGPHLNLKDKNTLKEEKGEEERKKDWRRSLGSWRSFPFSIL